ncbi:hypothetical protein ACFO25_01145 [Paenactinomyces guangxiensis]|uniref:Glycosyltransferase 2-like domain-containing protein n=1 Tax=Paenactinomyces guangxiensis TaxID=1490290 RepID=A0A7W1WSR7_9BACL|nr:hypothetical protein [Paenactinomyces guangxiensis]MBA4495369.1 hypothetical protein [Paenactinomyces guangxiensis]MBH8592510.1 hypothetical protein [Paenactinomyces guangxiensis]
MEQWILWSAALYVVMFFLLKGLSAYFGKYYHNKAYHLVMITCNSQHSIEWMIWSYHFWNETKGNKGNITCIDTGSTDDTLAILHRLWHRYPRLQIVRLAPYVNTEEAIHEWLKSQKQNKEKLIVLDLREPEKAQDSERHLA